MALVVIGLGILGIILALAIDEINKAKFIVSLVLSIILFGLGGYYYCIVGIHQSRAGRAIGPLNKILRVYQPKSVSSIPEEMMSFIPDEVIVPPGSESREVGVIIGVEDKEIFLKKDGEHLKIKKGRMLKIINAVVPGAEKDLIRVNFVGFIGDPKFKGEDSGYEIDTASLMKRYALDKEGNCYKIEVLEKKEIVATIYIDLI